MDIFDRVEREYREWLKRRLDPHALAMALHLARLLEADRVRDLLVAGPRPLHPSTKRISSWLREQVESELGGGHETK